MVGIYYESLPPDNFTIGEFYYWKSVPGGEIYHRRFTPRTLWSMSSGELVENINKQSFYRYTMITLS
jgi:hypothetical protein